jgi:hypothetical protein
VNQTEAPHATETLAATLVPPVFELGVAQGAYPITGTIEFDRSTLSTDRWAFQVSAEPTFRSPVIDASGAVGTGDVTIPGLAAITAGKHYIRTRTERGGVLGPWGPTTVHGDTVAPTITSSDTVTVAEGAHLSHLLVSDKPGEVVWSLFGGPDVSRFALAGSTLRFTANGVQDYETPLDADADNRYRVKIRATDLAGNRAVQTLTVVVGDNPADNPRYTEWAKTAGANRNPRAIVSGSPALNLAGTPTVGAAMMVRARRKAQVRRLQWELTVTALNGNDMIYIGLDDGTTDLADGYPAPGYSDGRGITFGIGASEQRYLYDGTRKFQNNIAGNLRNGDTLSIVGDAATGEVRLFRTRRGVTTQLFPAVVISPKWAAVFAVAGTNGTSAMVANFGQTPFARALDRGYGAY